jgi:hypothetical protein
LRKSERLRELEFAVIRMEMTVQLLEMTLNNLLEVQGMMQTPDLDGGKWYKNKTDNS